MARGSRALVVVIAVVITPSVVLSRAMRMMVMPVVDGGGAVPRADAIVVILMVSSVATLRAVAGAVVSDAVASGGVRVGRGVVAATPSGSSALRS